jgi:DNA-binding CsgD family transcriptional regulator
MTQAIDIAAKGLWSAHIQRQLGASFEALTSARGDARRLRGVFADSPLPMVLLDARRRYVDINHPARLWFRLSLEEIRTYAVEDLMPADQSGVIERQWARMLDTGHVAGNYLETKSDGTRIPVAFKAIAHVLPGLHAIVFAPAEWPDGELGASDGGEDHSAPLTQRELEVLALAADGLSGPALARELALSPTTVNTHFKNIYAKLEVRNRAAAVAKAMRLGAIA